MVSQLVFQDGQRLSRAVTAGGDERAHAPQTAGHRSRDRGEYRIDERESGQLACRLVAEEGCADELGNDAGAHG